MEPQPCYLPKEKGKDVHQNRIKIGLDSLPSEILDIIAFYCAMSPSGRKVATQSSYSDHLGQPSGPSSFSQIEYAFEQPPPFATPPVNLRNLIVTNRRNHAILNAKANPRLYARIFKTKFDVNAIARRFGPMAINSASLSKELQRRCICLKRIRKAVAFGRVKEPETGQQGEAEILENLWLAFLMVTENDGQNIQQLRWARIEEYLKLFRSQDLLEEAIRSGYPPNTTARALALHIDYMLSSPSKLASESRDESDEKLFVLRPFVFAAHRYDAFLAPWTVRQLPVKPNSGSPITSSRSDASYNPFIADLTPKDANHKLTYCGKEISIRPPNITHAACCSFFMKVEHDPGVSGINAAIDPYEGMEENISDTSSDQYFPSPSPSRSVNSNEKAKAEVRKLNTRDPLKLLSIDYDKEIARLVACTSPYHSIGLNAASHLGDFEGSWEGRFTFFDFDSYRDMLGGKVRSLYEGPFGEQPQVWKLREHVVKVNYAEQVGGKGSLMNAGYYDDDPEPSQVRTISTEELEKLRISNSTKAAKLGKRRASWEDEARERAIKGLRTNDGIPAHIMADWHNYPSFGHDEPTSSGDENEERQNDKYEILISGTGHSAWGRFILRGRVRSWDGLVSITKEYRPDGRGRWLYRGYAVAGNKLVGRWRDTFTPEDMSGYEG